MLKTRILTAVVAAVLLLTVLFGLPQDITRVIIALVITVAGWEWGGFVARDAGAVRYVYAVVTGLAIAALAWALAAGHVQAEHVLYVALGTWIAALLWLFVYPTPVPAPLAWLGGLLVLVPAWLALDRVYVVSPALLLFMLGIIWCADIGAYFAGRRFGRVKLAPQVSPGKTWEGVGGGVLLVAVLAVVGASLFSLPVAVLVPFCIAIGLISIVGDLTVSAFKRSVGLKDSGSLFPGHGGLLDRIDSIAAGAPLFALGMRSVGL